MLNAYKELTPVVYGENAIKYLHFDHAPNKLCFGMHWHERMEILRMKNGKLLLYLGEEQVCLLPGQAAVFTPGQMHCGVAGEEGAEYDVIMFDVERFCNRTAASDNYLAPLAGYAVRFPAVTEREELVETLDRLIRYLTEKRESHPLAAVGTVYELIALLYQDGAAESRIIYKPDERFHDVLEYINGHYTEAITARTISRQFGYNETYCCRRFREITGLTIMKYIQILRMELAQELLKNTKEEIGTIAWKCGYADIAYFSNRFKKHFGTSPSGFRES
ncbi:MAG: helix-turn-helix transcriptional regulator [Lachnospiraceae bacterium]|nr:helix-turn-helix transcriptional regulator [Lachnospiraceae bacterium]